jgi:3-oxoacyl-(acyl-carrier-protein) synthase
MKNHSNKTAILGIGWLDAQTFGCVNLRRRVPYGTQTSQPLPWQDTELLGGSLKNGGRMDSRSRLTCCACALALRDAGLKADEYKLLNIGIVGANEDGSLDANRAYFSDYLQGGRKLGRGNLFVYTLPTSPLAEASIHFGFKACLSYVATPSGSLHDLLKTAELLVTDGQADYMLACHATGSDAVAFLLGPTGTSGNRCGIDDLSAIKEQHSVAELALDIERFLGRNKGP